MQLILRNIMEEYVILTLDEILDTLDGCKCERCRLDIASYALNRLPARYVATTQGELMSRLCEFDTQFKATIVSEVTRAHEVIKKHPHHN